MARLGHLTFFNLEGKKIAPRFLEQLPARPPGHARECRIVKPEGVNTRAGVGLNPLGLSAISGYWLNEPCRTPTPGALSTHAVAAHLAGQHPRDIS
jgi:hypothetical protein